MEAYAALELSILCPNVGTAGMHYQTLEEASYLFWVRVCRPLCSTAQRGGPKTTSGHGFPPFTKGVHRDLLFYFVFCFLFVSQDSVSL